MKNSALYKTNLTEGLNKYEKTKLILIKFLIKAPIFWVNVSNQLKFIGYVTVKLFLVMIFLVQSRNYLINVPVNSTSPQPPIISSFKIFRHNFTEYLVYKT